MNIVFASLQFYGLFRSANKHRFEELNAYEAEDRQRREKATAKMRPSGKFKLYHGDAERYVLSHNEYMQYVLYVGM